MNNFDLAQEVELGGIYSLPGEGFVVELYIGNHGHMFDRQGLQYLIIEKKQRGLDASVEEKALTQINNLGPAYQRW